MDTNQIDARFEGLDRKVDALGPPVAELRRKAEGTTRANRECAKHERQLVRLAEEVAGLRARADTLGPTVGPTQNEAILSELQRLDARMDSLWGDLNAELQKLREEVRSEASRNDVQDKRLDDHDLKFASYGERIEGVEVTAGAHASAIASLQSESRSHRIHPATWVFSIIAGILGGWLWAAHDWAQTVTVNGTKTAVENTAANSWWAVTICGLCVGLLVFFVFSLFLRDDADTTVSTASASSGAGARVVIDRDAPTMAVPVVNTTSPPPPVANRNAGVY